MGNPILDALKPEAEALVAYAKQEEATVLASFEAKEDAAVQATITGVVVSAPVFLQGLIKSTLASIAPAIAQALNGFENEGAAWVIATGQKLADEM